MGCVFVRLQGEKYDGELFNAVDPTRLPVLRMAAAASICEFLACVRELSEDTISRVHLVVDNLTSIQDWFSDNASHTQGEILAHLRCIYEEGKGRVCVDRVTGCVSLVVEFTSMKHGHAVRRVMTEEQLEVALCVFVCACACWILIPVVVCGRAGVWTSGHFPLQRPTSGCRVGFSRVPSQ